VVKKFPFSYQFKTLETSNFLLVEYSKYSIHELLNKLRQFRNKNACGFAHERDIFWTPVIYPEWITKESYNDIFFRIIDWSVTTDERNIFQKVNQYSIEKWFNSTSCRHKMNNLNCGHPEETGLVQILRLIIAWLREQWDDFNAESLFDAISLLANWDTNFWKSFLNPEHAISSQYSQGTIIAWLIWELATKVEMVLQS
jgi:hypothetical protein